MKHADDLLENTQPTSRSGHARDLILDTLEQAAGRQMESDTLDSLIARQTGLSAKTIQNQRGALKNDGLIRMIPRKDEHGAITAWMVARTQAPRETAALREAA
jgi:hypothetical protein